MPLTEDQKEPQIDRDESEMHGDGWLTHLPRLSTVALLAALLLVPSAISLAGEVPKALTKGCAKGDAEACFGVGINLVSDDPPRARQFFSKACAGRDRKGCKWLHDTSKELMEEGSRAEKIEALGHFETACDRHYGRSCTLLATELWKGKLIDADKARAAALWQKGCANGSRVGCRKTGSLFEEGEYVPRDLGRALAFYQKSCDQELESACADAERLEGQGVEPSWAG